ncbi:MAG TPA: hypothetical protein VG860_23050 [Terriglobia bacterium]|jgi:hypothetical protein|nr:hypothetical protein [Terriglobia bacterium]
MKRSTLILTLALVTLAFAAAAVAQEKKAAGGPVAGTWTCTAHGGPNGDMPFTLYLEQQNESVTGSISSPLGDTDIGSATFTGGKLEIHINGGDENYTLTAKLDAGALTGGEWSADGGEKGTWDGKKGTDAATPAPAAAPAAKPQ